MENIIDIFLNNGIGVACIIYFMFRDFKFMGTLEETLVSLKESVELIRKYFITKEDSDDNK